MSTIFDSKIASGLSARSQTVALLDRIEGALTRLGSSLADVNSVTVGLRVPSDRQAVLEELLWTFSCLGNKPLIEFGTASSLASVESRTACVEIGVDAEVGCGQKPALTVLSF